jgi:hypothetical protein
MSNTQTGSDLLIREVADVLVRRRFAKIPHNRGWGPCNRGCECCGDP